MIPAMTIKPNTISPILPLRLSSFISQTKKPTRGIRKIRKKMILGVLSIIQGIGCEGINILKLKRHSRQGGNILSNEILLQVFIVAGDGDHACIICTVLELRDKNLPP